MKIRVAIGCLVSLTGAMALAQSSPSYRLTEYSFNAGGTPAAGLSLTSDGYRMTVASVGESVAATSMASAGNQLDVGFTSAYPVPGEVAASCGIAAGDCLLFTDVATLTWPTERSAGVYNLYRDDGGGLGTCEQAALGTATAVDEAVPPLNGTFFYLVTVSNRLFEEGTKGFDSGGNERQGAVCP